MLCQPMRGNRMAQQVTLQGVASEARQECLLLMGLDAFGHDPQTQRLARRNDRRDDRFVVVACRKLRDEAPSIFSSLAGSCFRYSRLE